MDRSDREKADLNIKSAFYAEKEYLYLGGQSRLPLVTCQALGDKSD